MLTPGGTAARAIALLVRDMPRAPLDWTRFFLSDEQYRRLMREIAYTIWSCDDREVAQLVREMPERIRRGGTLDDLEPPRRRRWWQRLIRPTEPDPNRAATAAHREEG